MKKGLCWMLALLAAVSLAGCGKEAGEKTTYQASLENGILDTYYEMSDGTWKCEDQIYQYRLVLSGRLPSAVCDSEYVVLTDDETLDFETVSRSMYSSSMDEIQKINGSKIVELR